MHPLLALFLVFCAAPIYAEVECVETEEAILLKWGGKPVLCYNKAEQQPREGMSDDYRRSGYIHPVYNPAGQVVTGDFAEDHPHQHGLFFAWTRCSVEGRPLEFWNQRLKLGRIEHEEVLKVGSDFFKIRLKYIDENAPDGPQVVLRETWTVRMEDSTAESYVIEILSEQTCTTESPLVIEKYHYGGMAIRGSGQWFDRDDAAKVKAWSKAREEDPDFPPIESDSLARDFLTSEGKSWFDGNHTRPRWVDMFGRIDGKFSGIAVLSHPSNFRFPQSVRLHPSKPYFCFAPMVDEGFKIEPGKAYQSRYRYVIHNGKPDPEMLNNQWELYTK
tara:strand:- start:6019 stop:7011 length:993 start_codon:yes stop_codon:yes gene_type:complete